MHLRFNTFLNIFKTAFVKGTFVFLLLMIARPFHLNAQQTMEDTKKQANKLFEDEAFTEAYKYYAQLVANFPKDAEYNYRLGVCMIYSEADKKKCLPYLKQATTGGEEAPKDVYFYLGKAYHINYLFDEAIKCYNEFKKTASPSLQKKLQVDREINACNNGKRLLSNLTDLEIKNKKQLNEADYFRTYDLKSIGGKLLVKPEEFRTPIDKKKKEKSIVYLPKASVSSKIFFSSYGENTETGKDIYFVTKTANGFGPPQKVIGINSEFDEDYPFLHPNGQTLYFSSKGFNSMGGYDIFKSTYDPSTNTWSAPENLQFPINSPDDDYLFVTDSLEKNATFSTGRQSPPGKIDVLRINTERVPIDVLAIKGSVKKENPEQGVTSFITITNLENNVTLGVIAANDQGDYKMQLPNGGKIMYSVETPGVKTQTAEVLLPVAEQVRPFKQEITYEKGRLKVINHFDDNADEDTYLQYLDVIEKKAKLDVASPEKKIIKKPEIVAVVNDSLKPVTEKKPTIIEEEMDVAKTNTTAVNNQTVEAKESTESNAVSENTVAIQEEPKTENKPIIEAAPTETPAANANVNYKDKANTVVKDANQDLQEAKQFDKDAKSVIETGTGLLADAMKNINEANEEIKSANNIADNTQRADVLNNAYARRASAQKDSLAAQNIVAYGNSLQADAKLKQKEAESHIVSAQELLNNGNVVTDETAAPPSDIAKKPSAKPKTKPGTKPNTKTAPADKPTTETAPPVNVASSNELSSKYEDKPIANTGDPNQIKQNNIRLSHYNREIDDAIKGNQTLLKKTKDPAQKQAINEEILSLQKQKAQNSEQIASNKESIAANAQGGVTNLQASNPGEAVKQIEDLKSNLVVNDNENFDFNAYQNPEAQKLKVEADTRINDALARQKKLKSELDKTIEAFLKSDGNSGTVSKSPAEMTAEADALHEKALKMEAEASKKPAAEKTKALAEAKRIENKANDTYLAASIESQINNQSLSAINQENLSGLIKDNKGSETDLAEAQKLESEANQIFQQAASLREEAKTASNKSAQLSKNFNAEEKEAEAIQKQKQAIDLLKKSNPEYVLKSSQGAASDGAASNTVQQQLDALNNSINEVAEIKIDSYTKLSMANTTEVDSLSEKVSENVEILDQNPKLKSDIISANNKLKASKRLLTQAENTQDKSKKLNLLISGVKKQNEALQQLIGVSNSMNPNAAPLAQNTSTSIAKENLEEPSADQKNQTEVAQEQNNKQVQENTNQTQVTENPPTNTQQEQSGNAVAQANEENKTNNENNTVNENKENPVQEPIQNNVETTKANEKVVEEPVAPVVTQNIEEMVNAPELKTDTNAAQVIQFFNNKPAALSNPAAANMYKSSMAQLKKYDAELAALENGGGSTSTPVVVDMDKAQELKTESESITRESDNLNIQSIEARKEAKTKEGAEKDALMAQATELENQALDKNIEASDKLLQSNEIEVQNNSNMIQSYFKKLKDENPTLYNELETKNNELATTRSQIKSIRDEANGMPNKGARFGSLSNAIEREAELLQKQNEIIDELKKSYPDFVYNPSSEPAPAASNEPSAETEQQKQQIVSKQQEELTKLGNALRLEFETQKYKVPNKLSPEDEQTRTLVMRLNAQSKRLLVQSAQQKDDNTKTKYLSLAAKYASESLEELSKIAGKQALPNTDKDVAQNKGKENQAPKNNFEQAVQDLNAEEARLIAEKKNEAKAKPVTKKPKPVKKPISQDDFSVKSNKPQETTENNDNSAEPAAVVRVEGLEIKTANAYNDNKPIPFDAKIEDGLIFRVQIGAFRNKLPNNTFKGLSPLNAETTTNGYFRYTAGNFNKFELANAVKNDLRSLGYSDAFVVGFYNGKRIPLSEALDILTKEGKMIDRNAMQTAGITLNANVPRAAANPEVAQNLVISKAIEKVNGLMYTIQIGVYNKQVTKNQLFNLRPIFSEELPSGLFRYAAGIYNNVDRLLSDKNKVMEFGVRDAFVTAYLNGKRIGFGEAKDKQQNDSTVKMETEEPIIFPAANEAVVPETNVPAPATPANIGPAFTNGVKEYPAATADNGVKKSNQGVSFKVQIGAYSKQVPTDVAGKFRAIKNWPIESQLITNLYIYSIGNFSGAQYAKKLRDEVINIGIADAFIVVYKDGKKLYGEDARRYLQQ